MAPVSRTIVLAALAAMVSAIPMNMPRQQQLGTVTETTWVTVDIPVTLVVDENGVPLSTIASGGNSATVAPTPSSVSTTTASPIASASSAVAPPPSVSTSFVTATASVVRQQVETAAPTSAPAAVSPVAAYSAPSSSAPAASSAAPVSPAGQGSADAGAISASSTNSCIGTGAACSGDITYWEGGVGACGWNINTNVDFQIALPWEYMGPESNSNKYCNQVATIRNPTTGQTIQAKVGDKCMGCTGRSIDLTSAAFNAIGSGCDGRCTGFEWWF